MATNSYYVKDDLTNLYLVDTEKIKQDTEAEFKLNFGQDLATGSGSNASILIAMQTKLKTDVINAIAFNTNQINPSFASNQGLESLCAFTETKRRLATATRVLAKLTGVAGATISAGKRASTSSGIIFILETTTVLDGDGIAEAVFRCDTLGAVPCPVGALNTIIDDELGWETITNEIAGVVGQNKEDDASLENRRRLELYKNAKAIPDSIKGAIYALNGVSSLYFDENITNQTKIQNNVTLLPHSIYVCVDGGLDNDIVKTLREQKTSGADYSNGASSNPKEVPVEFIDEFNDRVYYVAKFDRPDLITVRIKVRIKITGSTNPPINEIKQNILSYVNSSIYGEGFKINRDVSPFEIISRIAINDKYFVADCSVAKIGDNEFTKNVIIIEAWQKAITNESLIEVEFI